MSTDPAQIKRDLEALLAGDNIRAETPLDPENGSTFRAEGGQGGPQDPPDPAATRNGRRPELTVMFDVKGKLMLPESPAADDPAGQCLWLTVVLGLAPAHPITGGVREGRRGPDGHVALFRAGADTIRFEPASRINRPPQLIETLSWSILPTDDAVHTFSAAHCRQISHVVRMLCGLHDTLTAQQEAEGIIGTFLMDATPIDGCTTYGTTGQRYEAATSLRHAVDERSGRLTGSSRYLIDTKTDEFVIAVGDLQQAARHHEGSSVPHGWLDARLEALGWDRIRLEGRSLPGRGKGKHARVDAYRGHLASEPDDDATDDDLERAERIEQEEEQG